MQPGMTGIVVGLALTAAATAAALEPGKVLHLESPEHGHAFSLYVPGEYTPRRSWPLVLSSHGRGGSGKGEIGQWVGLAREHGFIVACPDLCTATHDRAPTSSLPPAEEDDQVLMSIYELVAGSFRINPRAVMITGFSGGGNPSYHTGLRHPDRITHICTRGGNFAPQQIPADPEIRAAGKERLQIYIYYGDNDHELILGKGGEPGQAQQAHDALVEAGYANVRIEEIAGMGHQSRPGIAAGWFGDFLEANRKLFLAGDKADEMAQAIEQDVEKDKLRSALRKLDKLVEFEDDQGIDPISPRVRASIDARAGAMVADARRAHESGDDREAMKILRKLTRELRDHPAAAEARGLMEEWGG